MVTGRGLLIGLLAIACACKAQPEREEPGVPPPIHPRVLVEGVEHLDLGPEQHPAILRVDVQADAIYLAPFGSLVTTPLRWQPQPPVPDGPEVGELAGLAAPD